MCLDSGRSTWAGHFFLPRCSLFLHLKAVRRLKSLNVRLTTGTWRCWHFFYTFFYAFFYKFYVFYVYSFVSHFLIKQPWCPQVIQPPPTSVVTASVADLARLRQYLSQRASERPPVASVTHQKMNWSVLLWSCFHNSARESDRGRAGHSKVITS